jgi:hypothetical protein
VELENINRTRQFQRRNQIMKKISLLSFLIVPVFAFATDFTVKPVTITLPDGFEGPVRQELQGGIVVAFAKDSGPTSKTLLQITVYNFGSRLQTHSAFEREAAASKYLLDFVDGVERRRMDFMRTEPMPLKISGLPAAKLQWTGKLQGVETVGVMYSFVVGSSVISFHTQDVGSVPTTAMSQATSAFESARVRADN